MARCPLLFALLALAVQAQTTPPVRTDSGAVGGEAREGILVFRGIPYAAAPVGDLRWRPPQPRTPWSGVRDCTAFGASCPQPARPDQPWLRDLRTDEDCLCLNIWTAGLAPASRPVMVWIHGGGMTVGSGSVPHYDGSALARRGVVVVTVNYRLGVLGFLAHPGLSAESPAGVSGNYGLLDQIASLQWVRRNIGAFGGDPENVTVFGESAGAVSVGCLLVAPAARGLFHRAILQSGTPTSALGDLRAGEAQGLRVAGRQGAASVADLRRIPAAKLVASCPAEIGPLAKRGKDSEKYGPRIDGAVLPGAPLALVARGAFHRVPILLGTNRDEMTLFLGGGDRGKPDRKVGLRLLARGVYKDRAEEVLDAFPCLRDEDAFATFRELTTVACFTSPCRLLARLASEQGVPVHLYHFSRVPPSAARTRLGATHGIEIPYVFGTMRNGFGDETDRHLSDAMGRYWTAFAATGDPQPEGLPAWPRHDAEGDRHLEFGDSVQAGAGLRKVQCDAIEPSLRQRLGIPSP